MYARNPKISLPDCLLDWQCMVVVDVIRNGQMPWDAAAHRMLREEQKVLKAVKTAAMIVYLLLSPYNTPLNFSGTGQDCPSVARSVYDEILIMKFVLHWI